MSNAFDEKSRSRVAAVKRAMDYAHSQDVQRPIADANERAYRSISDGMPFRPVVFNLSALTLAGAAAATPRQLGFSGDLLIYRREGSHPGGRLLMRAGGDLRQLYPGCRVKGPFTGREEFFLDVNSAPVGNVSLEVVAGERFDFEEPNVPVSQSQPSVLLGTVAGEAPNLTKTYVAEAAVTVPSGNQNALPAGAFCFTGFTSLRLLIQVSTAKEFTLIPWFSEGDGVWYENGLGAILVPDSLPTAQTLRSLVLNVTGNGYLYLYIVEGSVPGGTYALIAEGVA